MHEFSYDYLKPKYGENVKLCYMDTDTFIVHVKTDDIYKDIAEDLEKSFDASNYEIVLPKGKNEKVIVLMKDGLKGQMMKGLVELTEKTSYLKENNDENKKITSANKCIIKKTT